MALTRITKGVIKPNENYDTHNINSTGIVTAIGLDVNGNGDISGNLSVGGVLTYEDVTSIDSVGIITAQKDIHVGAGVSAVGVGTFGGGIFIDDSISHIGDSHTKIRFPTNDQISFENGGSESMRIYGFGQVLIGDGVDRRSGSAELTISGSSNVVLADNNPLYNQQNPCFLHLSNANNSVDASETGIIFHNTFAASGNVALYSKKTGQYASDLIFRFRTGGTASTERVRITSSGQVKVGTGVTIETNGQATYTGIVTATRIITHSIVGIASALPTHTLEVGGSVKANAQIKGYSGNHVVPSFTFSSASSTGMYLLNSNGTIGFSNAGTHTATLDNNGKLSLLRDLDVDGHTNLDNVSIAGVTTFTGITTAGVSYATDFKAPDGNTNGFYAGNSDDLHLFHNGADSYIENDTGNLTFTNKNNNNIIFKTTSSEVEKVRITSAGSVGVGTNNPNVGNSAYPVVQVHGTSTNAYFKLTNTTTGVAPTDGVELSLSGSDAYLTNRENANIIFRTNNGSSTGERLRITSDGKIGVNYAGTPPSETMMISSTDSTTGLSLSHLSGGNRYGFRLSTIGGTNKGLIISSFFNAGYTEALRINSNGDVTTTGQASFSRQNAGFTARAGDAVSITRASGTPLEINRTGSDGQMISLFDDNTQEAAISISGGSLQFGTPNSNSARLTITSGGKIGINETSPFADFDISSSVEDTDNSSLAQHGIRLYHVGAANEEVIPITAGFVTQQARARAGIGFISKTISGADGMGGAIGFYTRNTADGHALYRADERARVTETGVLLVGHTSSPTSDADKIQAISTSSGTGICLHNYSASNYGNQIAFMKSRSNTIGTNTILNSGDRIGELNFYGNDGSGRSLGAQIQVRINGTPSNNNTPAAIYLNTGLNQSMSTRVAVLPAGTVGISKNGWASSDHSFALTVHTGATSETGPVGDGIMIVSQQNSGNQNSSTGKLMFCGHAQTNGPFLYGDSEQAYGKKGLVFHTHSTSNSYSTQLEETARFTHSGRFGLGTGTAVDSLMHIQGNSDDGDEACQLTIEDEDTTAGSKIPSIQFKGNGTNTCRIRGTDTSGVTFSTWNGASQIQRSIIGNMQEGGAFLLNADDRGWATFRHNNNQGLRTHIRQRYAPGNAVSTYTILRIRRHWWGWGTYKIRLKALYYYGSQETTYYVNGHGSGGDNYSIVKETAHNNDWSAASVTKTSASNSSPGNNTTYYVDIQVNVPNYMYMIVYIEAYSSQYSTDPNNIGADSYCLM